jgi:hypothetical protein
VKNVAPVLVEDAGTMEFLALEVVHLVYPPSTGSDVRFSGERFEGNASFSPFSAKRTDTVADFSYPPNAIAAVVHSA